MAHQPEYLAIDWAVQKCIPAYTPMRQVAPHAVPIADGLYRIGLHAYMEGNKLGPDWVPSPDAPLAIALTWAESDGAAIRSCTFDIDPDTGVPNPRSAPPSEMLPLEVETFGDLRRVARERPIKGFGISQTYRLGIDGRYMHTSISLLHRYEFFYRGRPTDDDECPMAIRYRLIRSGEKA